MPQLRWRCHGKTTNVSAKTPRFAKGAAVRLFNFANLRPLASLPFKSTMPPNADAQRIIAELRLAPLAREGGWFRQTWATAAGSAIYYLMTPEDFSALHCLSSDEIWHFHAGDPVEHV